jgi:hypothetical protein
MSTSAGVLATLFVVGGVAAAFAPNDDDPWVPLKSHEKAMSASERRAYQDAIAATAGMVNNPDAQSLAQQNGLQILNLTWEDMGRYKGSAVGPNISDMTIQVGLKDPATNQFNVTAMPVVRHPNFSDVTTDIDPGDFTLLVGNEKGKALQRVSLRDFLTDPCVYLSKPDSWLGHHRTLLAPRDSKVLVSAQACFLPVPKSSKATFNPVVMNYQSVSGDPADLTILATREGTSVTVIDNKRDAFDNGTIWGQRLFHNASGMRASLTGERQSDFIQNGGGSGQVRAYPGLSMVLLIQVPLKQKNPMRFQAFGALDETKAMGGGGMAAPTRRESDVESAVIGHGDQEGPFTEIDNLAIERDPNYPVRVTVQFYKATSNGAINDADMAQINRDIDTVYSHGDVVGSLVTDGETGRPTEYVGMKVQPADWWNQFWHRYEQNTGQSPAEAREKLMKLLGRDYQVRPVCELYLRDKLRG